jgi:hypothetical protein
MRSFNDTIGNRTRDLPLCSAAPQTLRHRVHHNINVLCINYIVSTSINVSNAISSNNYGNFQDHIFLFGFIMRTREDLLEFFEQFGHKPFKNVSSAIIYASGSQVFSAYPKGSATSSQGIRGYVSVMATLKFNQLKIMFCLLRMTVEICN